MRTFAHLSGHSEYSSDSNATIKELVAAAAADGQTSLALTDTNLTAAPFFRDEARRHGIKPIIGLDVKWVENRHWEDRQKVFNLTLLAEDRSGWHSLVAIYNSAAVPGRSQAFVDYELLSRYAEGLIVLTGGRRGPIDTFLHENDADTARTNLTKLEAAVGPGRVFLEASFPGAAQLLTGVFMGKMVHVVATGRYRQVAEADTEARETLLDIRAGKGGFGYGESGWLRTAVEMRQQAPDKAWQDAVTTAATIADAIHYDAIPEPGGNQALFPAPAGFRSEGEYLRHLAFRGAGSRFDEIPFEVIERLNAELEVIISKGAAHSILIAHDLIQWCADNGILTGARGHSSSSLVLFCLGITDINPLTYGLRYERFLRPERTELPGLDIDIQASRRQDAHGYLAKRWPDRVARAATHSQVKAETWIGRGLVSKEKTALVEGRFLTRHIHPCALVIAPRDLTDHLPALPDRRPGHEHELPVANWEPQTLLNEGYLVLNLLGSSTLDVIAQTAEKARLNRKGPVHLGLLLPDGDGDLYPGSTPAAWDLITKGDTDGVFQLGVDDAVAAAKAAQPRNLTDMAALIALYGKEERLNRYLAARKNRHPFHYHHLEHLTSDVSEKSWLIRTLEPTHGEIVFQEQVMDLFVIVGGFSGVDAVWAWRFLAKKSPDWMTLREKFIEGAVQEQYDRTGARYSMAFSKETAERVFDLMIESVPCLFSASHAHAYARHTIQTAWLRAHFPEEFQAVLDEVQPRRPRPTTA